MSKKKKNEKKEELLKLLNDIAESDEVSSETKEKMKELSLELDKMTMYSKFNYIIAYIIVYLAKTVFTYLIALILIGLFANFMVVDKMYIFLVPLGVSLIFNAVSIATTVILDIQKSINSLILTYLFVLIVFLIFNIYFPIFKFGTIWLFYLFLVYLFDEYIMYKLIRRKLWTAKY